MKNKTLFRMWSPKLKKDLPKIHELLLADKIDEASFLYNKSAMMIPEAIEREIKRERHFVKVVSESKKFRPEESATGLTPRQALISAALSGWRGDSPCPWHCPATRETIIAWGASHYDGPIRNIEITFNALELEGLFFEIHPTIFHPACYYCCFDPEFLKELTEEIEGSDLWDTLSEEYDDEYWLTWRKTGLCAGQGSQGPSDARWGPCVGPSCVWFQEGKMECNHGLSFNQKVQQLIVKGQIMLSTFISYGGPDELFAERLCRALESKGVKTWFFPRDALPGAKLHHVMREGVNSHDRVVLVCSKNSLQRRGVLNEIEQALSRESREGGSAILIPVTIDDYLFSHWNPEDEEKKQEVLDRVVADFRAALNNSTIFEEQLDKLVMALRI